MLHAVIPVYLPHDRPKPAINSKREVLLRAASEEAIDYDATKFNWVTGLGACEKKQSRNVDCPMNRRVESKSLFLESTSSQLQGNAQCYDLSYVYRAQNTFRDKSTKYANKVWLRDVYFKWWFSEDVMHPFNLNCRFTVESLAHKSKCCNS